MMDSDLVPVLVVTSLLVSVLTFWVIDLRVRMRRLEKQAGVDRRWWGE